MAEEPVPGPADCRLAGQLADGAGHHGVDVVLTGVPGLVPVAVARPAPVNRAGIVDPDNPARVNSPGLADGLEPDRHADVDGGGPGVFSRLLPARPRARRKSVV